MSFELKDNEIALKNGIANDISRIEERSALYESLKNVQFWVEANDFEIDTLFNNHSTSARRECIPLLYRDNGKRVSWKRGPDETGHRFPIGYVKGNRDLAVWIKFYIAKINGKHVCFYQATSDIVDYFLIEEWLQHFFGNYYRLNHCDSANFYQCLLAVNE